MPGLKDRLTDAGYGLGWSVVCRLPESWAQGAFRFFADFAWRRRGRGVQVLEGNLRRVIGSHAPGGQLRALSRQVMRSYARYWLEAFWLPVMPAGWPQGCTTLSISGPRSDTSRPVAGWSSPCRTWATTS
jgi:KDO2-lipid IV(A) lauroyltransferase